MTDRFPNECDCGKPTYGATHCPDCTYALSHAELVETIEQIRLIYNIDAPCRDNARMFKNRIIGIARADHRRAEIVDLMHRALEAVRGEAI